MSRNQLYVLLLALVVGAAAVIVVPIMLQDRDEPVTDESSTEEVPDEETALQAAEVMTTWKPAEDYNRTDAEIRAAEFMTEELANSIEAPQRPATGQEWTTAAEANATSHPTVEVNQYTDTQPGTVSVFASWEWITESGETLPHEEQERIYYFAFNDQGQIHDYTYETVRR